MATTTATADRIKLWQEQYKLSYHVPYAMAAEQAVGLAGKRVLEVGGSLPEGFVRDELGAAAWIAMEAPGYWSEFDKSNMAASKWLDKSRFQGPLAEASLPTDIPFAVYEGGVEDVPEHLHGQFDVVFSIAAFEHIPRMPSALRSMAAALRPGGKLFSMWSPIWPAFDGHHLPRMFDRQGKEYNFHTAPIPQWGHLLMSQSEMYEHLCGHLDQQTAAEMVFYIYCSPHINRLFVEDYVSFFRSSSLGVQRLEGTFPVTVPPAVQEELQRRYPGREAFRFNGMLAVLEKPTDAFQAATW